MVLPRGGVYSGAMADIFDVLSDATRRDLLGRLLERRLDDGPDAGELSVGQLVEGTGLSQPTVSKHLKVLREHGLVSVREEGQHRYYRLDTAPLGEVEEWLAPFTAADGYGSVVELGADATPYFAWSGSEMGESIGRKAAEGAHLAESVIHSVQDAAGKAGTALQDATGQVAKRLPKPLQVGPFKGDEDAGA